jgi:hypothetical protein
MRSIPLMLVVLCTLLASPAAAVSLLSDVREIEARQMVCDLDCVWLIGNDVPAAPFADFDSSVSGGSFDASQVSQLSPALITGQGAASGSVDGLAFSTLDIQFEVLVATSIVFDGTLTETSTEGDATTLARLDQVGGSNVFQASACGSCGAGAPDVENVFVSTLLAPGIYALSIEASVGDFGTAASYDFTLAFVPEATTGTLSLAGLLLACASSRRRSTP